MASSAPAATLLDTLPARPPTPPRESGNEADVALKSLLVRTGPLEPGLSLQTPPSASQASTVATNSNPSSSRLRKKVEWSSHTEYKEPPNYSTGAGAAMRLAKSSPASTPSSASFKPVKGILKPSSSPNPLASSLSSELNGTGNQVNITEMLDSTIKQLAGTDRDSRLDAYMILARALKASNNLPDRVALQDKMSLFMQFIQRDVGSKTATGTIDSSLTNQALNLLATFLHYPAIASTLTFDFGVFLVDHSIRSFEDSSTPKDVARHLMQVIAFQNFSPKVMTLDRVGRLVTALHRIEDHLKGKSIVMSRIHIYKRLIKQARGHMAVYTDWLKDVFTDMLSTIRDIQAQAISLGTEAGFALRSEKPLMRKVTEILHTPDEDGQAYIDFYMEKLSEMFKSKRSSSAVPEIWSVTILFLRCPLERWAYYNPWLRLIQSAFNTTDSHTKQEANYAWNRYVYLSLADSKMTPKLLQTLGQPLLSQLKRKLNAKQLEEGVKRRRAVIGGACNLYYYALRPGTKNAPDMLWEFAIMPVMSQLINPDGTCEASPDGPTQACRMLVGLLDGSTPRVWRDDRIVDLPPVKPDELPAMDSKWVRRNCDRVFQPVGTLLEKRFTDLANKESLTYRLWQALVGSVAAASAKDIKVSEDTAKFFACTFGLLSKVWSKSYPDAEGTLDAKFLPSMANFIALLVDGLGLLPFTEKKLSMTVTNTFEPVATPSHRPDRPEKPRGTIRTPLQHLFAMVSSLPSGGVDNEDFLDFLQAVFEPFLKGKSAKSRGELVRDLLQLVPQNSLSPFAPWVLAARTARSILEQGSSSLSSPSASDKLLGPEYRDIVSLLERGLSSHPNLPSQHWFALFDTFSVHVGQELGDAGRAIVLIEPISKVLLDTSFTDTNKPTARSLEIAKALFKAAILPRDRQALEAARRRLWGAPAALGRGGSSDPFDNLYRLGNQGLQVAYNTLKESDTVAEVAMFFEAVGRFLSSSHATIITMLPRLQAGLFPWIQDGSAQLHLGDDTLLSQAIRQLWDRICAELDQLGRLDKTQLDQLEPLLTAGFKSKHRFIVNRVADTWNKLVKDEDHLECSDSLMSVLSSLRSKVDLVLPGVEQASGDFGAQAASFVESQDDISFVVLSSTSSSRGAPRPLAPVVANSLVASKQSNSRKRRRDATPEVTRARTSKRTSTPRLRHDNSQIQFAPIASSSPLNGASQHLTERQKVVRDRQRETAALYSDIRTSSLAQADRQTSPNGPRVSPPRNDEEQQKATPERPTSYEDLISSTPTPRRGQVFQLDDEPPSSPPEPRPYPLLSEIQSRSRASSSLDNWEFSSPPGSPLPSRQQVAHDVEPPHLVLTNDSTQNRVALSAIENAAARMDVATSLEVIPSSAVAEVGDSFDDAVEDIAAEAQELPTTPPQRSTTTRPQETPKSADDEFVDARSSPLVARETHADAKPQGTAESFDLSRADESALRKLVIELESGNNASSITSSPLSKRTSPSPDTRRKRKNKSDMVHDCITVSSPPSRRTRKDLKRSSPPVVPSTPVESISSEADQDSKKRKRKRGGKNTDGRRKRRRSAEVDDAQDNGSHSQGSEWGSSPIMRMPQRALGLKSRRSAHAQTLGRALSDASTSFSSSAPASDDRVGDTDEEVMSQLVTESNAASQSQSPLDEAFATERRGEVADSMDPGSIKDKVADESVAEMEPRVGGDDSGDAGVDAKDAAAAIMTRLQGGLDELRQMTLSRGEFHRIEDLLMDMKRELFEAELRGRESAG